MDKRRDAIAEKEEKQERSERVVPLSDQWEYKARNLKMVAGVALEDDFNKRGAEGWEFVAVADGYAIFKRRRSL